MIPQNALDVLFPKILMTLLVQIIYKCLYYYFPVTKASSSMKMMIIACTFHIIQARILVQATIYQSFELVEMVI